MRKQKRTWVKEALKADNISLTYRERRFAEEFVHRMNATASAIAAGYSETSARAQGCHLMKRPAVLTYIEELRVGMAKKAEIKSNDIIAELKSIATHNMIDYITVEETGEVNNEGDKKREVFIDLSRLTREQAAAITEISVDTYIEGRGEDAQRVKRTKVKLADKTRALELLGKYLGMFADTTKLVGKDGGDLEITVKIAEDNPADES